MMKMIQTILFLCLVSQACTAPMQLNSHELSGVEESESSEGSDSTEHGDVSEQVTDSESGRTYTGSDIILTAASDLGQLNEKGQSAITVSLRDENTKVSMDVVTFILKTEDEDGQSSAVGESDEGSSERVQSEEEDEHISTPRWSDKGSDELDESNEQTSLPPNITTFTVCTHNPTPADQADTDPQSDSSELVPALNTALLGKLTDLRSVSVPLKSHSMPEYMSITPISPPGSKETTAGKALGTDARSNSSFSDTRASHIHSVPLAISLQTFQTPSTLLYSSEEEEEEEVASFVTAPAPSPEPMSLPSGPGLDPGYVGDGWPVYEFSDTFNDFSHYDAHGYQPTYRDREPIRIHFSSHYPGGPTDVNVDDVTEGQVVRPDPVRDTTPAYSWEDTENVSTFTKALEDQNFSDEDEHPEIPSDSPSVAGSSELPSEPPGDQVDSNEDNPSVGASESISMENSRETFSQPPEASGAPPTGIAPAASSSMESTDTTVDPDVEESEEANGPSESSDHVDSLADSNSTESQTLTDARTIQAASLSDIQSKSASLNLLPVRLTPVSSSEELEPDQNTPRGVTFNHNAVLGPVRVEESHLRSKSSANAGIKAQILHSGSTEDDDVSLNAFSPPSARSEDDDGEESPSSESVTDRPGITMDTTPQVTPEHGSVSAEETPAVDSAPVSIREPLISSEEVSAEISTTTAPPTATANAANNSVESQEVFTSSTVHPVASEPLQSLSTQMSSEEGDSQVRVSDRPATALRTNIIPLATPPRHAAANPWMAILQALSATANQRVRHVDRTYGNGLYYYSNKGQKASSSEESS